MEKIIKIIAVTLLFLFTINNSSATFFKASSPKGNVNNAEDIVKLDKLDIEINNLIAEDNSSSDSVSFDLDKLDKTPVKLDEIFKSFADYYEWEIPKSYKFIQLNIIWADKNSEFYQNLQKLVYVDILPNWKLKVNKNTTLSAYELYKLAENLFDVNLVQSSQIKYLKSRKANINDLKYLKKVLDKEPIDNIQESSSMEIDFKNNSEIISEKQDIFDDVYKTLKASHFDKENISDIKLIEWATKGLANGSWDKFTTYFPPVESKDFMESLDWKFEWIWAYVEMEKPWILKIISPIPGSPSEKAGLKWWDIILKADDNSITETTSLNESIAWIKGPKGSKVKLTILRDWEILEIDVTRDTIIIKNVESKKLDSKTYYIKLLTFWDNISWEFTESLKLLKKEKNIKKLIIDLRNNPGGYLHEVSNMLWHFVPKWKETAVVKYLGWNENYYSEWYDLIDFSKYRIIILQNSGSASASEIFVWTLKDYFPEATIIGEQSYWKGSVQTIKPYSDGSSLKYTIAKWFTWKSQTWIDWVWIPVDIKLEFDFENFKRTKVDNQLEKAKNIK